MTLSKRLALLGVRSMTSVSKSRGVASSYGLIDRRRPFPYRQISDFTNDSRTPNHSLMKTREEDSSPPYIIQLMETRNSLRNRVEVTRAEVEKMRTEQAKAGFPFVYRPRKIRFSNKPIQLFQDRKITSLHPDVIKFNAEMEKFSVLEAELAELEEMRIQLTRSASNIVFNEAMDKIDNSIAKEIREFTADVKATRWEIHILGTAIALAMPALLFFGLLIDRNVEVYDLSFWE